MEIHHKNSLHFGARVRIKPFPPGAEDGLLSTGVAATSTTGSYLQSLGAGVVTQASQHIPQSAFFPEWVSKILPDFMLRIFNIRNGLNAQIGEEVIVSAVPSAAGSLLQSTAIKSSKFVKVDKNPRNIVS